MFLSLPIIGSIAFSPTALIASHPMIAYELAGHTIGHILYGFIKRNRKRRGLSRAQMRKMTNRRRRHFVDNIIMHHQRLAKMNRQTIVGNARERAMARREKTQRKADMQKDHNFVQKYQLQYDWFIRFRTEMFLLSPIDFNGLCPMSINARARKYVGPKRIQYGMSIELPSTFSEEESFVEVDDQIYIFHKNVIDKGGFSGIESYNNKITIENETVHTEFWNLRGIPFNIIPINALFMRDPSWIGYQSGNLNM